jgi:GMP synthase (glutamine-hydrolysing)
VFWGVQYHPELDLHEVAGALRRQGNDLVSEGYASSLKVIEQYASSVEALHQAPERQDLAWFLGVDEQVLDDDRRTTELRNFLRFVVEGM